MMEEIIASGHMIGMISRITSAASDIQLWEWHLAPPAVPNTPETRKELQATGYIEAPEEPFLLASHMLSQLGRAVFLDDELWAYKADLDIAYKTPVTLAFAQELDTKETILPLVSPLPVSRLGEYAIIADEDKLSCYNIAELPEASQDKWIKLVEVLARLASPTAEITPFNELHAVSENVEAYRVMTERLLLETRKGKLAERAHAKYRLALLETAHREVQEARKAWGALTAIDKWKEVQCMMHDLADDYNAHHKKASEPDNKPVPYIADVFNQGLAEIITAQPFQAYIYGMTARAEEWAEIATGDEKELILSYTRSKPSGTTFVQIREELKDIALRETVLAKMWEQVQRRSELHCDVYLALIAQLERGGKDADGYTCITSHQILSYRGIVPKTHKNEAGRERLAGYKREDLDRIAECVNDIKNIYIKVYEQEIIDPTAQRGPGRKKRETFSRESPLFVFGDIIYHNELPLDDGGTRRSTPIAWEYRKSKWMMPFLEGANHMTGVLFQKVLNYDYYHERWEKRLSRHFMYWLRINASHAKKPALTIGNLIEELNLEFDPRYPEKARRHFESAMDRLAKDGIITWRYKSELELPARKWLPTWLQSQIIVEDPPQIKSQYMTIAATAKAIREKDLGAPAKRRKSAEATKKGGKK